MTPYDSIRYYQSFLHTAMTSVEPQTGHIKAWVGGIDYKHFQESDRLGKRSTMQAGSTFKPFVYVAAMDLLRLSPCDRLFDSQYCIEENKHGYHGEWCPKTLVANTREKRKH